MNIPSGKYLHSKAACRGLCLLLTGALTGCADPTKAVSGAGKDKLREFPIRSEQVSTRAVRYEIRTNGTVEAQDIYRVDVQVPGMVEGVDFKEGDLVTPKTILFRISPQTYQLAAQKAEAAYRKTLADLADSERRVRYDLDAARIRYHEAEQEIERRRPALSAGAISEQEILTYQTKREMAALLVRDMEEAAKTHVAVMHAAAREKEAEWKLAEDNVHKSSVQAPIAGVIEQRMVTNGMQVTPGPSGTPMALLVDKRSLRIKFSLPERQSAHVPNHSRITFQVQAHPGKDFFATVYRIGDLTDAKTRVVTCWAKIEPSEAELKPGFFASIRILTEEKTHAVVVPQTTVLPTEDGFVAFVVEDGKARRRKLVLGIQVENQALEVISGLKLGERVVVEGANALQEGAPVREKSEDGKAKTMDARSGPPGPAPPESDPSSKSGLQRSVPEK